MEKQDPKDTSKKNEFENQRAKQDKRKYSGNTVEMKNVNKHLIAGNSSEEQF